MKRLDRENTNTPDWWEKYYSMQLNKKPTRRRTEEHYKWLPRFMDKGIVLDIGCGQGWGSKLLEKNKELTVAGADISTEAIRYAIDHSYFASFRKMDIVNESLYFEYDYILLIDIIEHLEDPFAVVDKCLEKTRKRLFISVPNRPKGSDPETTHINIFTIKDFRDRYPGVCLTGVDGHFKIMIDKTYRFEDWKKVNEWLRNEEGIFLEKLIALAPMGDAYELGAYQGRASLRLARVRNIMSVDNFSTGAFKIEKTGKKEGDFFEMWQENVEGWPCKPLKMDHGEFWSHIKEPAAFFFIDGSHTYDNTLRDLEHAYRWLKPGGILAVHDASDPTVWKAIKAFGAEYKPEHISRVRATMGWRKKNNGGRGK